MKVEIAIPDKGLITSMKLDGREIVLDPPIEVKKGDKVIDLTGANRQAQEWYERMGNKATRDFIESN